MPDSAKQSNPHRFAGCAGILLILSIFVNTGCSSLNGTQGALWVALARLAPQARAECPDDGAEPEAPALPQQNRSQ